MKMGRSISDRLGIWFAVLVAATLALTRVAGQGPGQLDRQAILNHLNAVITWYRLCTNVQAVGLPSDAVYQENAQHLAAEVVRRAFESARAEAAVIIADDKKQAANSGQLPASQKSEQGLRDAAARTSAHIEATQAKLEALNKAIASAPRSKRQNLIRQRDVLKGELSLNKAMLEAIEKMFSFVESSKESGVDGLETAINELARSVPEVEGTASGARPQAKPNAANPVSSGLLVQVANLFTQLHAMRTIDALIGETERLRQTAEDVRRPLRQLLVTTIREGRNLADRANQSGTPSSAELQDGSQQFENLTARFKQLSAAAMPLSQEIVFIEQSRANFAEWRKSIGQETSSQVRALAMHLFGIAVALAAGFALSEMWRRLTFRYVHDARRRRQFLLLRRFVMGFFIGMVLIIGFVSEFSSLATFAGFVTAGVAVALQAVLLSLAAYFFVMGRYGIRVGDRISVAGVTGDVIDIGLIRLYLMELAGTGVDLEPTGRVVVISNAVMFQAATPLFKQIPGTEYTWHEVAVPLAPNANYQLVQQKILEVVNAIYARYRDAIERQLSNIERHMEMQLKAPVPQTKLQFADNGLEFMVRYPVPIRQASDIDDNVTKAVLEVVNNEPELKASVTGLPKIRAPIRG